MGNCASMEHITFIIICISFNSRRIAAVITGQDDGTSGVKAHTFSIHQQFHSVGLGDPFDLILGQDDLQLHSLVHVSRL